MNRQIKKKLDLYPSKARQRLIEIRDLVYEVAEEEQLGEITEDIKWGEPSFSVKKGSPFRMGWKSKQPNQVSLYFNCKTTLVETFKRYIETPFNLKVKEKLYFHCQTQYPLMN